MEKNYTRFKKFKELDLFIQNSLDKYFYVEPWKKLYERTGKLHRDIISDKSTIPDLIIYNKTFNKSDCFIESKGKTFIKFPRMRFILRPKYKKEYNPFSTYGDESEVYFYFKRDISEDIKNKNISLNKDLNDSENIEKNETKTFLKPKFFEEKFIDEDNIEQKDKVKERKQDLNIKKSLKEEDDEEEPEWANDNVENYNNIKIEFKAIPKFIEDKMNEEIGILKEEVNNINLNNDIQKNKIDIDNFFNSNGDNNLNNVVISSTNNNKEDNFSQEIRDFIKNSNNENDELKEEESNDFNNDDNNENDIINDSNDYNINLENKDNINKHFNIFDTENKFNHIFIGAQETNNSDEKNNKYKQLNNNCNNNIINKYNYFNNNEDNEDLNEIKRIEENKLKSLIMIQQQQKKEKENQQYLQILQMQKMKNQLLGKVNNPNYMLNQQLYYNLPYSNNQNQFYNDQNLLLNNNTPYNNLSYMNNINNQGNKSNFLNLNNINYFPFKNKIQENSILNNNIPPHANIFNNIESNRLNININNNYKMNDVNNNKEEYVNNVNNMIYLNNQHSYLNNLNNIKKKKNMISENNNNNFTNMNINNINQNNWNKRISNNIFPQNYWKNIQNLRNDYIINNNISNINNNENNINKGLNINNNNIISHNNAHELKNTQKDLQNTNPAEYLENPTLILNKNIDKKYWLVLNKSDGAIIHYFKSGELLKFLEEKYKSDKSLEEFTINDIESDFVFPPEEVYESLRKNLVLH